MILKKLINEIAINELGNTLKFISNYNNSHNIIEDVDCVTYLLEQKYKNNNFDECDLYSAIKVIATCIHFIKDNAKNIGKEKYKQYLDNINNCYKLLDSYIRNNINVVSNFQSDVTDEDTQLRKAINEILNS